MKTILTVFAVLCCATLFSQAGALDSSFASNGKFNYNSSNYPYFVNSSYSIAIQKDGKILLAGYGYNYNVNSATQFAVLRLNKDGSLDNTFGNGGTAFINFSSDSAYSNNQAFSIALQADGKIVVAGVSFTFGYIDSLNTYNNSDIAVARLNTNGTLDATFNGTGTKLIDLSSLTRDPNNYTSTSSDYCFAVAVKGNGAIVLGCTTYVNSAINGSDFDVAAIQLKTDGSFDPSFAGSGIQILKTPSTGENIQGIGIQKDGKIVLAGNTYTSSSFSSDILAVRLLADGTADNSFDGDGRATVDFYGGNDYSSDVAILPNSKIVLSCYESRYYDSSNVALVRLNANGRLDNSFNGTGKSVINKKDNSYSSEIAIQKDGKIIQTGTRYANSYTENNYFGGNQNFIVLRYKANGGLDSSFGTYGRSVIDFGNYTDNILDFSTSCALQSDGKIIAAGVNSTYQYPCAARLLTTGRNISLTGPADQSATAPTGECTVTITNVDPVLYPDTSASIVKYSLYNNNATLPYDSGYGSVSGKPFPIGNTTVVYSSTIDPLQRAVFNVNITGGTPAGALDFDGINDRVAIQYLNPINSYTYGQYSFEGWVKVRGYNKNGGSVIFGDERNNNGGILVSLDTKGYISTYQPTVGTVTSKYKVPLNKWTHIAFVQSSSTLDLYVNGKFVQTLLTAPYLHVATYGNFYLGAYTTDDNTFTRNFNGEMDEVRVWGNAICQGQIQNNLHCEIPDYPSGLVAYFTFNQGLASCNNQSVTYLDGRYTSGTLQNFALNGPVSNWVAGYVTGSCAVFVPLAITSYPYSVNVQATNDSCSATANFTVTASSGCSDSVAIIYSQNPGTSFPVGTTYVSATAQDNYGNTQYVSFPVTVTENTPPVLVLKDTSLALNEYGSLYVNPYDLIDTLYDNCSPNYYIYVYSSNNYFNCYNAGANSITITATDQSGNSTTKTAIVTVLPYAGSASVLATPNPQQYSDVATLQATLYGAQNLYFNGCSPASDVTFKVGSKVIGTTGLYPDYYGNLIATANYQLTDIFPKKVTATFNGLNTSVYNLPNSSVTTTLNGAPENAVIDYIESQIIESSTNKVTIPVSAQILDTADGYNGDIRKAIVTFTIQPVTAGTTVIGSNTLTVSALSFVSADHTSGVARGSFTVNTGGNQSAKFNIIVTVSNYYTGSKTVVVYVKKSSGSLIASDNKTALSIDTKSALPGNDFGIIASPNPSSDQFTLQIKSSNLVDKINIRISDVAGKVLETFSTVNAGEIIQFGSKYRSGVYIAEVVQGTNKKSIKLIKL